MNLINSLKAKLGLLSTGNYKYMSLMSITSGHPYLDSPSQLELLSCVSYEHTRSELLPLDCTVCSGSRSCRCETSTSSRCLWALVLAVSKLRLLHGRFEFSPMPLRNFKFFTFLSGCLSPLPHRNINFITFVSVVLVLSELRFPQVHVGLSPLPLRFRP